MLCGIHRFSDRIEAPATPAQKRILSALSPQRVSGKELAGEKSWTYWAAQGSLAARPSGTEDIYEIYAESFRGKEHLRRIADEAQAMVDAALA